MESVDVKVGDLILFLAQDKCWYRGIVVQKSNSKALVFCPDYGFYEKMILSEKKMQPLFCQEVGLVKFFASRCQSSDHVQLKDGKLIKVKVLSREGLHYLVKVKSI